MSLDTSSREDRAASVLADYFAELEAGGADDWRSLIDRHPDLASELRSFFAQREVVGQLLNSARAPQVTKPSRLDTTQADAPAPHAHDAADTITQTSPPKADSIHDPAEADANTTRIRYFGDYELQRVLGRGGMGIVYEAKQISLNRPVALKMIRAGVWADSEEVRRFKNEAESVANLDHPGIVPVYEVGQYKGQHYFTMKLVEGSSLDKVLAHLAGKPKEAARLVAEVARAVHHAHERGILHRDLKPSNILLDRDGRAHVTDFGLARRIEGDSSLSVSGAILGTPQYMSPEQAEGSRRGVTTVSDVYGLGAVLYALLTGRPPFQGGTVIETLEQVRTREPERPTKLDLSIPRDLERIALKCLEKDPQRRYNSAASLADDLDRFLKGEPILARRTGPWERSLMWARRKPAMAGLAAASLVALAATAGLVVGVPLYLQKEQAHREAEQQRGIAERSAERAESLEYQFRLSLAERFWREGDLYRAAELVRECKTKGRRWEWYFLDRLLHSLIDSGTAEESRPMRPPGGLSGPTLFASAPQGIVGVSDASIQFWHTDSESRSPRVLARLDRPVSRFVGSADGQIVAASLESSGRKGNNSELRVWSTVTGKEVFRLPARPGDVVDMAMSGKGECLALALKDRIPEEARLEVWDLVSREGRSEISVDGEVLHVAVSPNGTQIAAAVTNSTGRDTDCVILWNAETGQQLHRLPLETAPSALAFSRDGEHLAVGEGSWLSIWHASKGAWLTRLVSHSGVVRTMAFSPDGTRLTSADDQGAIKFWNWELLRRVTPLPHNRTNAQFLFADDPSKPLMGVLVLPLLTLNDSPEARGNSILRLTYTLDGHSVVAGGSDRALRLYEGRPRTFTP